MMAIEKIGSKEVERVSLQEEVFVPADFQEQDQYSPQAARALHQVFNKDTLEEPATAVASNTFKNKDLTSTFWDKLFFWRKKSEKASISPIIEKVKATNLPALSPIPTLEPPAHISEDLQAMTLPPVSKRGNIKNSLTSNEMREGLAQMSERSIDAIMFIVYHAQLEWEKEHAQGAEKTFSRYLECQKLQEKVLQEIKDVLDKDEKTAKTFNTWQKRTLIASTLSGILTTALQFGFGRNHPGVVTLSSISTILSASLAGATTAAKTYFKRRSNEHRATHAEYEHRNRRFDSLIQDARERFTSIAETDNAYKERLIRHLKRLGKMSKLACKK